MPSIKAFYPNPKFEKDPENQDEDLLIEAEFTVTSLGSPASWDHPGDPCEWEVDEIYLEGEFIPSFLTPWWWKLKNWYWKKRYGKSPRRLDNPLWYTLAEIVDKAIEEDFDWTDYIHAQQDDYDDWQQSRYDD